MNKFKFYFILLIATLSLFSCNKNDDDITTIEEKPYSEQKLVDTNTIDDYLKSYYIFSVDEDLSITFAPLTKTGKIKTLIDSPVITGIGTSFTKELEIGDEIFATTDGITTSVGTVLEINNDTQITLTTNASLSTVVDVPVKCFVKKTTIFEQTTYPIKSAPVKLHGIEYTVKYLVLREGTGTAPTNTDAVLAAYKGFYLQSSTTDTTITDTDFEEIKYPSSFFSLLNVVMGWSEMFPLFKSGTYSGNDDGTVSYKDFGAGVLFIPSGLGYYSFGSGSIPGYAPLVFSFKLYDVFRSDTDGDGLPNYQEDKNNDRYMYSFTNIINYPTYPGPDPDKKKDDSWYYDDFPDRDGIPNYLDIDDDGDKFTTAYEILKGTNYLDASSHP